MRYRVYFDKTINQLIPYYLGGRKLILYLQSLMKPLQLLNDIFSEWATEMRIEVSMTSQVFKLEWFLTRKFKKYFLHSNQCISIRNGSRTGVPVYWQSADIPDEEDLCLTYASEGPRSSTSLYYHGEATEESTCSFIVYSPPIDDRIISSEAYQAMLSYYIEKYRVAGKTYKIKFNV